MSKNQKIIIKNKQCAFPKLDEPKAFVEGTEGKFSIKVLIPKDDKEFVANFKNWVKDQIEKTDWSATMKKQVLKTAFDSENGYNDNCTLKDGDHLNTRRVDEGKEPYDFYKGHYIVSANRKGSFGAPLVVGTNAKPISPEMIRAEITGGYWVNVQVGSFCYSKPKAGISIQLIAVQKVKSDTPFGQQNPFDILEEDEVVESTEEEGNPFA